MDYDSAQVAQLVNIPPAQIDYLVRSGVIVPTVPAARRGMSRRFSVQNLFEFAVAAELMEAGIKIVDIAVALYFVREESRKIANQKSRKGLMLVRYRRVGDKRQQDERTGQPHLIDAASVGTLAATGYTVVYAIPIGYIANIVEKTTGESLPVKVLSDDTIGPAINEGDDE